MKTRTTWIFIASLVGLVLVLGGFFVSRLEKTMEKVEFGPNAEARANSRLAALRLLERFGYQTRILRDPEVLPAKGAVVMLPSGTFLDPSRVERWREWVNQGGVLVMGLDLAPESREPLLRGIARVVEFPHASDEKAVPEGAAAPAGSPPAESPPGRAPVDPSQEGSKKPIPQENGILDSEDFWTFSPLAGGEEPALRLAFRPHWVIPQRDFDRCDSGYYVDEGGIVAIYPAGEGHLVLLADDSIFDNERIAGVDHALFLWHLLKYFEDPPEVAVLLGDRIGLLAWLWQVAAPLLVALLLLTLMYIWEKAPRFGPLVLRRPPGQRGLRAHLQAASAFLWRRGEQAALLEPLRAEVLRRAHLAIPGWPAFTPEKCRAELARIARLPERAIAAALVDPPGTDPKQFVALVATLETLRKAL